MYFLGSAIVYDLQRDRLFLYSDNRDVLRLLQDISSIRKAQVIFIVDEQSNIMQI